MSSSWHLETNQRRRRKTSETKTKENKKENRREEKRREVAGKMQPSGQKVVLLGETAVGKSSKCGSYSGNDWSSDETLQVDGRSVKFEIWDTAGKNVTILLAPMYYRGAKAALVVYDITDKDSFGRAQEW